MTATVTYLNAREKRLRSFLIGDLEDTLSSLKLALESDLLTPVERGRLLPNVFRLKIIIASHTGKV